MCCCNNTHSLDFEAVYFSSPMTDPVPTPVAPKMEPDADAPRSIALVTEPDRKRPRPADDETRVWRRMEWFQRQIETLWQERDALAKRVAELERARPRDAEGRVMEYVDARFAAMSARWDARFDDMDVRLARRR